MNTKYSSTVLTVIGICQLYQVVISIRKEQNVSPIPVIISGVVGGSLPVSHYYRDHWFPVEIKGISIDPRREPTTQTDILRKLPVSVDGFNGLEFESFGSDFNRIHRPSGLPVQIIKK